MGKTAKDVMNKAISFIGTKERPANSNNVVFNTNYYGKAVYGSNYPWCCSYVWDVFRQAGASDLFYDGQKTAYCPTVESWGKSKNLTVAKTNGKYGDIVLFDFSGLGVSGHIGFIVEKNSDGTYKTIEGNTAVGNDANGGMVMYRTRSQSTIRCIIRPKYEEETKDALGTTNKTTSTTDSNKPKYIPKPTLKRGEKGTRVKRLQRCLKYLGENLSVDGDFGSKTETCLKNFQKKYNLNVDGVYGTKSYTKLKKVIGGK